MINLTPPTENNYAAATSSKNLYISSEPLLQAIPASVVLLNSHPKIQSGKNKFKREIE